MTTEHDHEKRISESERRIEILEYVKERQEAKKNTTKAIVIRYMKDKRLASRETTHYLINDLIKEGKLNKKEINSQVHFLTINEDNGFNKIYNFLSEIESLVDKMNTSMKSKFYVKISHPSIDDKDKDKLIKINKLISFLEDFIDPYRAALDFILHRLLSMIKVEIDSEKDSLILYTKVIPILDKLDWYFFYNKNLDETLDEIVNVKLKRAKISPLIKMFHVDTNLIDNITEVIEHFRIRFPKSEQKTTEPHEKSD